jgi:hypothetical protein
MVWRPPESQIWVDCSLKTHAPASKEGEFLDYAQGNQAGPGDFLRQAQTKTFSPGKVAERGTKQW